MKTTIEKKVGHTPGPWVLSPLNHETDIHGLPCVEVHRPTTEDSNGEIGALGEWVCYVRGNTVAERTINARIIAAAPELLEALKKAQRALTMAATESYRSEIQQYYSGGYVEMIQGAACADTLGIDAAIRKATI
jgi:hypothetical protein